MKVTPNLKIKHKTVDYEELKESDAFIFDGDLYVKNDIDNNQYGVCLTDIDGYIDDMCGTQVIPVNAEVRWSYKDKKNTKGKTR